MADFLTKLPDDILCKIFSSLTLSDAFSVKSLSPSWKHLPDTRTRLKLEDGNRYGYDALIDGWNATALGKEIEELDLGLYGFCQLDTDYSRHLRLTFSYLWMDCDASTRWLSKLLTLELVYVPLCVCDVEFILSSCPNLESLTMIEGFKRYEFLLIRHPSLKKLVITGHCDVELSCPQLETYEFQGFSSSSLLFSNVPLLKEVSLKFHFRDRGCSEEFIDLARNGPLLQTLCLWLRNEVPPLPPTMTMSCLKRLDLVVRRAGRCFDLFTIMHMLYASPVLEELKLMVDSRSGIRRSEERRYLDRPHFHLKEVKIVGVKDSMGELIEYLLRNGVSLQRMVFLADARFVASVSKHMIRSTWQTINPNVELTVQPGHNFLL